MNNDAKVLRTQRQGNNPIGEILRKATAAYTDQELADWLGDNYTVITRASNGNPDVIECPVSILGLSTETRPLDQDHVRDLIHSDHTAWEPLEVCFWPQGLQKPEPSVRLRIISGNHRTSAAKEMDQPLEKLSMHIYKVESEVDFRQLAIRTNVAHGLNFSEDQRKINAFWLKDQGLSQSEIASTLLVNKSTISRWFSGTDSNVSRKKQAGQQPPTFKANTSTPSVHTSKKLTTSAARMKIQALLQDAGMPDGDLAEARGYYRSLKPDLQQKVISLYEWMHQLTED